MTLQELGEKHGTDKTRKTEHFGDESYLHIYERYLGALREGPINLLELGVRNGNSLRMWKEYFPNARIYGVDYDPRCAQFAEERIEIAIASQDDAAVLESLARRAGGFDVIVDDASHINHLTVASFRLLFPHLNPQGFYVIEDLGMSWVDYTKCLDNPEFMEGTLHKHLERGVPIDHQRQDLDTLFGEILLEMDMIRGDVHFLHFWPNISFLRKTAASG